MSDHWASLTDPVLLIIFVYLQPCDLNSVSKTCKRWCRIANDETIWRMLVKSKGKKINKDAGETWKHTYKRITYHVPCVLAKELKGHEDEIFAVGFSHSGKYLATAANDGCIKIWNYDEIDSFPKSRKISSNHYTNYVEFNQSETLLLINAVRRDYDDVFPAAASIVILSVADDDLPVVCVLAEPFIDFRSTWYNDSSFLGTVNSWDRDRVEIYKCEVPEFNDTTENDIDELCNVEKTTTFLCEIDDTYTDHHMIKVLDVTKTNVDDVKFPVKSAEGCTEEKVLVLFNGGEMEIEKCGIYIYHVSPDRFGQRRLPPIATSVLKSDCLGVCISPDKRFLCVNTRRVESVDYDAVDDDGNLENLSYFLDITMHVYDLQSDSMAYTTCQGNRAIDSDYCCFMLPSANEHFIASGSERGEVLIWDRQSCELLSILTHIPEVIPRGSCVNSVAFHPKDPEVLVSVADDKNVKVWKSRNRIRNGC